MNFIKKPWVSISSLALVLTIGTVGCGTTTSNANSSSSAGASTKSPQSVSLYTDMSSWNNTVNQVGQYMAKEYGIGLKPVVYPDTTTYEATIDQSITSSNPPDIMSWWNGQQFNQLVATGQLADLTGQWKIYEKEGLNPNLAAPFTVNGHIYGAPAYVSYYQVYYSKKVFYKYGLKPPKTWAQFLNICNTLKSHGVTPIGQTTNAGGSWPGFIWFEELLVRSNPSLYNQLMAGKASYTSPGVVKVMKLWAQMEEDGYFTKGSDDMSTGVPSDLAKGNIGMYLIGDWYNGTLIGAGLKPGVDYGSFLLPDVNPKAGNVVIFETAPLVVSKNGTKEQTALKALQAFYKPDVQTKWDQANGYSPIVNGVKSTNVLDNNVSNQIKNGKYTLITRYWEATPPDIAQYATNYFVKFMLEPNTYMQDLQAIQNYAANYWASHK